MKRYWFELLDENYNDLGASINDGSSKTTAMRQARRWMAEHGIVSAILSVNSLRTSNILDIIGINI